MNLPDFLGLQNFRVEAEYEKTVHHPRHAAIPDFLPGTSPVHLHFAIA